MLATAFDMIQIFLMPNNDKRTSHIFGELFTREFQSTHQHLSFYNWINTTQLCNWVATKLKWTKQKVDT